MIYVVYKVKYTGEKLSAKYYIGSTSLVKFNSGTYFGSIKSKRWKKLYKEELLQSPHLFTIEILSEHSSRQNALLEELNVQKKLDVVKSELYFNESFAQPNGFFGRDVKGVKSPTFGKKHSIESKQKMSNAKRGKKWTEKRRKAEEFIKRRGSSNPWFGKHHSEESKQKMRKKRSEEGCKHISESLKGKQTWMKGKKHNNESKQKISKSLKGRKLTEEHKRKISNARKKENTHRG